MTNRFRSFARPTFRRTLLLIGSMLACLPAQAVVLDGRDWRQPLESVNFTWNEIATACDTNTGACTGEVVASGNRRLDVDGWTWAGATEMASLFELITGAPDGTFDVPFLNFSESELNGATWASDFIDIDGAGPDEGYFDATLAFNATDHVVFGLTRSIVQRDGQPPAVDRSYIRDAGVTHGALIGNPVGFGIARSHTGHWFYKNVSVPAPAPLAALALALLAAGLRRR